MPLLSATNAIEPALEQMKSMLFRPFRVKTWLKIGFIGWLAGGASGSFSINTPSFPGGKGGKVGPYVEQTLRSWFHEHLLLIASIVALLTALTLVFIYLSCRFRFILFDSILQKDAQIGRGWARYGQQAQRYFGFLILLLLISGAVIAVMVGLPLWHAYTSGVFDSKDPLALFRVVGLIILAAFVFAIIGAIIMSLANDFGVPLLALDDMTLGGAWSALRQMIAAEPWAFAGYLGMKLVLSIAAGAMIAIAGVTIFLVLLIPGAILVLVGMGIVKALGSVAGFILAAAGGLVAGAIALIISMLLTAPLAVFFTSYSLYFFGGRYPKLGALLWPQPPAPVAPPPPAPPPVPSPGASPFNAPA
jgi:hypothetical protein